MSEIFSIERFEYQLNESLNCLRTLLERNKIPILLEDTSHSYLNKYEVMNSITELTIQIIGKIFKTLNLTTEKIKEIKQWSENRNITLRFQSQNR